MEKEDLQGMSMYTVMVIKAILDDILIRFLTHEKEMLRQPQPAVAPIFTELRSGNRRLARFHAHSILPPYLREQQLYSLAIQASIELIGKKQLSFDNVTLWFTLELP